MYPGRRSGLTRRQLTIKSVNSPARQLLPTANRSRITKSRLSKRRDSVVSYAICASVFPFLPASGRPSRRAASGQRFLVRRIVRRQPFGNQNRTGRLRPARSKGASIHRRPNRMRRTARFSFRTIFLPARKRTPELRFLQCSAPMAGQPNRITSPSRMPSSADVTSVSDTSAPQLRAPSAIASAIFSVFPAPDQYTMCIIL